MKLKRSTIRHIAVALPALTLLGMTACSSDDAEPNTPQYKESDGISLTIPLSSTRTGDNTEILMDNMFIATYDENGDLIETIYKQGEFVKDKSGGKKEFDKVFNTSAYGTVMQVVLPSSLYEEYASKEIGEHYGIRVAAFYIPTPEEYLVKPEDQVDSFESPSNLSDLNTELKDWYALQFPEYGTGVWKPETEDVIPMSGLLNLTPAVENYDHTMWNENNPMFLNNEPLMLERTMAKIIVNEGEGVGYFSEVSLKTPKSGTLMPELSDEVWNGSDYVKKATVTDGEMNATNQTYLQTVEGERKSFTFYTFESDFVNPGDEYLIHLTWKNATGSEDSKDIAIKWYGNSGEDGRYGQDSPVWTGVLRNHIYEFTLARKGSLNPEVQLSVKPWIHDRYEVDF